MSKKPNVLLIMTDQQRYDSLGCYGIDAIPTPNLDRLAKEGVRFDKCYVNNPVCTPSRASIFTGKLLPDHGVYKLNDILPEDEIMFPEHPRNLGYQTALIGKMHVSGAVYEISNRNKHDGFDMYEWCHEPALFLDGKYNAYGKWLKEKNPEFYKKLKREGRRIKNVPSELHGTYWTAERTIELLRERNKDVPFFYYMSIFDPHNPYIDYPEETGTLVDMEKLPKPVYEKWESAEKPEGIRRSYRDGYMGCFADFTENEVMEMKKGYYASVAFIDRQIGRVINELENQGILDDTMVIFMSDHGDLLGDHELFAKGAFFYDPGVRVPFIIRYPKRIKSGTDFKGLVQPHDLTSTILAEAGMNPDKIQNIMPDSKNILDMLESGKGRSKAVCLYRGTGLDYRKQYYDPLINCTMIHDGRYKLNIYHNKDLSLENAEGELYDLLEDPFETRNLFNESKYCDIKSRLKAEMNTWLIKHEYGKKGSRGGECTTVDPKML